MLINNSSNNSVSAAIYAKLRAIYAIFMREILTRHGNRRLGYVWAIIEPIIHITIFAVLKYALGIRTVDGINTVIFLASGFIPYFYFRDVSDRIIAAIPSNKGLLVFPQLKFTDFFLARLLLETFSFVIIAVITFTTCHFLVQEIHINSFLEAVKISILLAMLGYGHGLIFASISPIFESIKIVRNFILRLLYFFSGIMFSVKTLPESIYKYLQYNPIAQCLEMFRDALFLEYHPVEGFNNTLYVFLFAAIQLFIGYLLVLRTKKWLLK